MKLKAFKVSTAQLKKVKNVLPIPTICPNCGGAVERVSNSVIYGKEYGAWPFAYRCVVGSCDSYVGIHPKTDVPLGTLANKAVRAARKQAKAMLSPMWEVDGMDKNAVYAWLAKEMGIADVNHCHIGWFDAKQCDQVVQICLKTKRNAA
jgi:hypothetical protein